VDLKTARIFIRARGGVRKIERIRNRDYYTAFVPTIAGYMIAKHKRKGVMEFKDRSRARRYATRAAKREREVARRVLARHKK